MASINISITVDINRNIPIFGRIIADALKIIFRKYLPDLGVRSAHCGLPGTTGHELRGVRTRCEIAPRVNFRIRRLSEYVFVREPAPRLVNDLGRTAAAADNLDLRSFPDDDAPFPANAGRSPTAVETRHRPLMRFGPGWTESLVLREDALARRGGLSGGGRDEKQGGDDGKSAKHDRLQFSAASIRAPAPAHGFDGGADDAFAWLPASNRVATSIRSHCCTIFHSGRRAMRRHTTGAINEISSRATSCCGRLAMRLQRQSWTLSAGGEWTRRRTSRRVGRRASGPLR